MKPSLRWNIQFEQHRQILFDGKNATVEKHLNEMIKIKFDEEIINNKDDEIINDNKDNENSPNKIEAKMWVEVDNEKLLIKKLNNY